MFDSGSDRLRLLGGMAQEPSDVVTDDPDLPFHVIVSPSRGRFEPSVVTGAVQRGDVLGYVAGEHGRRDAVVARTGGTVRGALRLAMQPVQSGEGLFWVG